MYDELTAVDIKKMKEELEKEGIYVDLDSAYRSVKVQQETWDQFREKYGEEYTVSHVAVPGYSEHHTGLAADIVTPSYQTLDSKFEKTEAFKWLYENCAEFGFVLRYGTLGSVATLHEVYKRHHLL